jgi:hypothetical protein
LKIFKYREKCKECSRCKYYQLQGDSISYSCHFDLFSYSNENGKRPWEEKIDKSYLNAQERELIIQKLLHVNSKGYSNPSIEDFSAV